MRKAKGRNFKGSLFADIIAIIAFVFAMYIILPVGTNLGDHTTQQVVAQPGLNATQQSFITATGNGFFNNLYDVTLFILTIMLVIASWISATHEGANPAATLMLGLIFIVLAEIFSMGVADAAHQYINFSQNLAAKPHYTLTSYLLDNLPVFVGIFMVAYILFVVSKRQVIYDAVGFDGFRNGSSPGGGFSQ